MYKDFRNEYYLLTGLQTHSKFESSFYWNLHLYFLLSEICYLEPIHIRYFDICKTRTFFEDFSKHWLKDSLFLAITSYKFKNYFNFKPFFFLINICYYKHRCATHTPHFNSQTFNKNKKLLINTSLKNKKYSRNHYIIMISVTSS